MRIHLYCTSALPTIRWHYIPHCLFKVSKMRIPEHEFVIESNRQDGVCAMLWDGKQLIFTSKIARAEYQHLWNLKDAMLEAAQVKTLMLYDSMGTSTDERLS